jgi:hypothetical protein
MTATRVGVLLCLVLAGTVSVESDRLSLDALDAAAEPADEQRVPPSEAGVTIESGFTMPPIAAYAEVLARPPFAETRRPPPPASRIDYPARLGGALVGVIIGPAGRHALVEHGEPARLTRVVEGQEIDGWTIRSILRDRIILLRDEASGELKIKDRASSSGTAQLAPGTHDAAPRPPGTDLSRSGVRRLTASQIPAFIPGPRQPPAQEGGVALPAANAKSPAAPVRRTRLTSGRGGAGG